MRYDLALFFKIDCKRKRTIVDRSSKLANADTMSNLVFLIMVVMLLVGMVYIIGKEYEERYPQHCDYLNASKQSNHLQKLQVGAFVVLDWCGDMIWPGSRDQAIYLKRMKKTKKEHAESK